MKRAITNAIIFTVNEQDRIIKNGTVIIDGEKITAVGSSEEVKIPEDTDEIIDCKGEMALLPGLIDTHNHSSLMRGVVENQRMVDWLPVYDLEHRACMEEDAYHAARLCYLECLKNGTTTIMDMYRFMDRCAEAAGELGIPYYVMNFKREFKEQVMDYFIGEYRLGRTPNPCIACNRYVKWEALLHRCLGIGADYIATGHYGNIKKLPNGRFAVTKSASLNKDQSYVLYNLTQEELSHTLFPISTMEKDEVRKIAERAGLPVAHKKDSQDICFIKDGDYASFIEEQTGVKSGPGDFVDSKGNVLGRHAGIIHYTVGQRKGLGIAFGEPRYVIRLDVPKNQVVLGTLDELMTKEVLFDDINYMSVSDINEPVKVTGKVRYSAKDVPCTLYPAKDGIMKAVFEEPVRAATPGQAAVFYKDGCIVCGGSII